MHRLIALSAVIALAAAPGCDKKTDRSAAVDVGALLSALPGNSRAVLGVDVAALARSRYVRLATDALGQDAGDLDAMQAGCGVAPKDAVAALLVSIPGTLDPLGVVVAARTRVERATIAECAVAVGAAHDVEVRVQDEGKMTAYHQGEGGAEYVAWADSNTAVLIPSSSSDPLTLREMLGEPDRASGNPTLFELADRADTGAALWAIADLDPGTDLGRTIGAMPVADKPIAAHAAVTLEGGVGVRIGFQFATTDAAQAAATFLDTQLRALGVRTPAVAPYLESLEVKADDRDAIASVRLTDEQADQLIDLLRANLPAIREAARPPLNR